MFLSHLILSEEEGADNKGFIAPYVCWSKERIENDVKLSTELIQKLDAEKGIESNPVLAVAAEAKPG